MIFYWSVVLINMIGKIRPFSVVRQTPVHNMSGYHEGVGKAAGSRPRSTSTRSNVGGEDRYPARDIRYEEGQGTHTAKTGSQRPSHVPKYTCSMCQDLCCGLARELVSTAFGLGKSNLSRWVSLIISTFKFNFVF